MPKPLTMVVPDGASMGQVTVRGTGEPGQTVQVVANSRVVGTTEIAQDGQWRFGIELSQPGIYAIGAQTIKPDGSADSVSMPVFLLVSEPTATPKPTSTPVPTATSVLPTEPTTEPTEEPASVVAPDALPPTGVSSFVLGLPSMGAAGVVLLLLAGYVGAASRQRKRKK